MENDAKSCYDRMISSLIMLTSRSVGLSRNVCRTVGSTFAKTKHHITTWNVISKNTFGYTSEKPIFGSWQEATKSVVNWILTSSVIQTIHCQDVPGAAFETTDGKVKFTQSTVSFVDDNNNCVSRDDESPKLEEMLQTTSESWEKLLFTTGELLS